MMNLNEAVAGAVASSLYPEMRFSWEIKVKKIELIVENHLKLFPFFRALMPCFVMV